MLAGTGHITTAGSSRVLHITRHRLLPVLTFEMAVHDHTHFKISGSAHTVTTFSPHEIYERSAAQEVKNT